MTDIGGDPDDEQSIVRFLLYACDLEVTDAGQPPLVSYRRAVLKVRGEPVEPPPGIRLSSDEVMTPPAEFLVAPKGPWTFQRAVNVNGQAVTIDGRRWESEGAANLSGIELWKLNETPRQEKE